MSLNNDIFVKSETQMRSPECGISSVFSPFAMIESKEEGKDQESIQSSSTPDTGHHLGK